MMRVKRLLYNHWTLVATSTGIVLLFLILIIPDWALGVIVLCLIAMRAWEEHLVIRGYSKRSTEHDD